MTDARKVVHTDPEIMGGTPVFVGTRVPAQSLFVYLEAGDSLEDFLEAFPTVSREQAIGALGEGHRIADAANAALDRFRKRVAQAVEDEEAHQE
ncbi:MAG: DUF433 domain-containing protein [Acidobacteriota bacterium]